MCIWIRFHFQNSFIFCIGLYIYSTSSFTLNLFLIKIEKNPIFIFFPFNSTQQYLIFKSFIYIHFKILLVTSPFSSLAFFSQKIYIKLDLNIQHCCIFLKIKIKSKRINLSFKLEHIILLEFFQLLLQKEPNLVQIIPWRNIKGFKFIMIIQSNSLF